MALFAFTALRPDGSKFSDEREAGDKQALIAAFRSEGVIVLSAEVSTGKKKADGEHRSVLKALNNLAVFSGVPHTEKILFARNLASMMSAGLPLSRAVAVLLKQTRNANMKKTLTGLGGAIKEGNALNQALARYPRVFPALFVSMVRAGEESGTLSQSLQMVAVQMEKSYVLIKKVRGAMIYPGIVVTVMVAIGVLMLIYVVPTLAKTFASLHATLPLPTRIVLNGSMYFSTHLPLMGAIAVALIAAAVFLPHTASGKKAFDRVLSGSPVIGGIVAKLNAARTARTLSSLLAAGIPALQALEITEGVVQNSHFKPVIARAREAVEKGKPVSEEFVRAENIYPVMFSEMAAVGEETGDLPGMLAHVADFYEQEVEDQTKDLSTIIEPLLMVVIGAGVGFFAVAMIMPIYSLSSSL